MKDKSGILKQMEIKRLKLVAETPCLLIDPALILDDSTSSRFDSSDNCVRPETDVVSLTVGGETGAITSLSKKIQVTENIRLIHNAQKTEEVENFSIREDRSVASCMNIIPPDSMSDISFPLNVPLKTNLPIVLEIEDNDNVKVVAKIITLEEGIISHKMSDNGMCINEKCSDGPMIKASVVSLELTSHKNCHKGIAKSVFELECVPLWGSVSICGLMPEMEDAVVAVPHFMKIPIKMFADDHVINGLNGSVSQLTSHFFGLYDGHGGSQVANYCRDRIHFALEDELHKVQDLVSGGVSRQVYWERTFTNCFTKVDSEVGGTLNSGINNRGGINNGDSGAIGCTIEPVASETVGSTAVVALVCSSHIIVSNCGDSRAVLCRGKEAVALSVDHKPNREDELARIVAAEGKVFMWDGPRVSGVLAMSRSIGDRYLKPFVISEPEVMIVPRTRDDECLILASDGLWDVMTNEQVCKVARGRILLWHKKNGTQPSLNRGQGVDPAAQAAAEYLSNLALQKGSEDNISIIVIDLKSHRKFKTKS